MFGRPRSAKTPGPATGHAEATVVSAADMGLDTLAAVLRILGELALDEESPQARSSVTLAELAGLPLVSLPYESRTRRIVDGAASTAGYTLHHVATVTQFATMMSFVRAGLMPMQAETSSSSRKATKERPRRDRSRFRKMTTRPTTTSSA